MHKPNRVRIIGPVRAVAGVGAILLWLCGLMWAGTLTGAFKVSREGDPAPAIRQLERGVDLSGTTYQDARGPVGCTSDCSGHEAGWAWAETHLIFDPDDCGGRSESFIEGCRAWAEEQAGNNTAP